MTWARSVPVCLLVLGLLAACSNDPNANIYEGGEAPSTGITVGDDTTNGEDPSGDGDGDGDASSGDGDGDEVKLDILFEEGADDGPDPEDCLEDIDIVFVMDVSTTMGPFFDELEDEIQAVHDSLAEYDLPNPPHYGLVVFVDDFTLVNTGAPYTDVDALRADFNEWNQFTATNQQTQGGGFNSTWTENSLDALFAAAGGFQWRPKDTTLRIVIHTTDDTFWNGPTQADGVNILHNYPETVDALQAGEIRMFAFADVLGGQSGSDDVSMGFFSPYQGAAPIPEQTGGAAYNISEVLAGVVSLSVAISDAVGDSYCEDYPPVD